MKRRYYCKRDYPGIVFDRKVKAMKPVHIGSDETAKLIRKALNEMEEKGNEISTTKT